MSPLIIPAIVYAASYTYLAVYHHDATLWQTVIHESGVLTLRDTVLYSSHFLGHVPTHTAVALFFAIWYSILAPMPVTTLGRNKKRIAILGTLLIAFLGGALLHSTVRFGWSDTVAFITQNKQQSAGTVTGGSWNLHLPSLVLAALLIPVYIRVMQAVYSQPRLFSFRHARPYLFAAAALTALISLIINWQDLSKLVSVSTDARYQAHSIRELATFPLTYFPLPLVWLWWGARKKDSSQAAQKPSGLPAIVWLSSALGAVGIGYQIIISSTAGINTIAQKPSFALDAGLSIPYLLASHYFEHALDTIFFFLLSILFIEVLAMPKNLSTRKVRQET